MPKQARTGALMDVPKGVQRCAMPPTQAQTGAQNTRAPKPWTQNQTDAQYRAETSEQNWKQVQQAFLDGGRAAAPNPQRNQRTDGAEHLLDAQPSSTAPYPRDTLRLAARQPGAPKQHASEAPPFAAPQSDAYCCYRCSSCAHYTTRHAAPPLANAKKLHVVEKMPPEFEVVIGWK